MAAQGEDLTPDERMRQFLERLRREAEERERLRHEAQERIGWTGK